MEGPDQSGPGHFPFSMDLASDVQIQRPSWAYLPADP